MFIFLRNLMESVSDSFYMLKISRISKKVKSGSYLSANHIQKRADLDLVEGEKSVDV